MRRTLSPIFIVGSSRSGTSLLRRCLSCHPDIYIVGETHYFDDLRPRLLKHGRRDPSGSIPEQAIRYFRMIDVAPYGHFRDPEESTIDPEELKSLAQELDGAPDSYFEAFCMIKAKAHGKSRWGEKTPRHVYRVSEILDAFPRAQIIFTVRDPRAVLASYRDWKIPGVLREQGDKAVARDAVRARKSYHPLIIALMWKSAVRRIAALQESPRTDHICTVRYEDLIQTPEEILTGLCAFLKVGFTPKMLDVPMDNSSYSGVDFGAGLSTTPLERWRSKLSNREIAAVQACCGAEMESHGYCPDEVPRYSVFRVALWLTLPFAVIRAAFVNRSRFPSLPDYLWRRIRPAVFPARLLALAHRAVRTVLPDIQQLPIRATSTSGPHCPLSHLSTAPNGETAIPRLVYGTGSALAHNAARIVYSIRMLGIARTAIQVAVRSGYHIKTRKLQVANQRAPQIEALSRCSWLKSLSHVEVIDYSITSDALASFMSDVRYPRYYYRGYSRVRSALWHMVGLHLCDLERGNLVLDIGAHRGIWGRIARKKYRCDVFDVDLQYSPGIRGTQVGADAAAIPIPSNSVSHIVSFCAFNCMEGTSDIGLMKEATRLLRPGGKLVIVPLCIGDEHVNLYDPLICTQPHSFDPGARQVAWWRWGNNFGRWYDRSAFSKRVLANTTAFKKTIYRVRHISPMDSPFPQFYAGLFTKLP